MASASSPSTPGTGSLLAIAAMGCVQLGLAASVDLSSQLGATGVAWLRLVFAALLVVLIARPWRARFTRRALLTCVLLGVATAGMTVMFMAAVIRIPLGTASALEFLGPLGVAVASGRGTSRLWALVAAVGVIGLTEPWHGGVDLLGVCFALGAAVCWAGYIVLTQRAGDAVTGLHALAVSFPVAALVASFAITPAVLQHLSWPLLAAGLGLALLLPVVPFLLEFLALRRLSTSAFGTLMSLEPAIALMVGFLLLGQVPRPLAVAGIALVIAAGIGATRSGARDAR
ncbi:DMT family transporter [Leucobacter luti]|uniref:EamA family transporter n=1 Tax=Leucobacter luti TaxID=340320 RepID=UPI0010EE4B13|nr:EamA family transporter [Leucobacter luti]MCW2288376.1 inner membrane transporter RhtA [Leucobacter luti]QYM75679.1 EamA family transporter [Leucobacter luti]TCK45467.1 inner membrane transporter RhtA [Leucobacter luti]